MDILVAPDKFKGTLTADVVAELIAGVCRARGHRVTTQPLADGGDGTLAALGGANRTSTVTGPLGDPVVASWRWRRDVAVIEMAQASGLALVGGAENNDALAASTVGTGELIDAAVGRGARRIVVGVGGSATTDGGWGAVQALHPVQRLRGVELVVACDVRTRFVDAATVFGPQKGAGEAAVALLQRRLERLVQVYLDEYGVDVSELVGAGAAGGLAGGLAAIGAELVDGFSVVADACDLDGQIESADLVITGEGRLDPTSFDGKVVGGVAEIAADFATPVAAVVGSVDPLVEDQLPVVSLADTVGDAAAFTDPSAGVVAATEALLDRLDL
ncbi:MAG: glycerate kinase [Acidimicrobiales bacterium]